MALLPEQEELLGTLVEAARGVPRHQQQFLLASHATFGKEHGLIAGQWRMDGGGRFTITADGIAYYEQLRQREPEPGAAIVEEVRRYLDDTRFTERFPAAHEKLRSAEELLWRARPEDDFTTIGHKLREALQQFATAMVERHQPPEVDADPAKTKNRLRAVLELHRDRLGERKTDVLDALLAYHDAVNGLIQRQEHGDQKPDDPLTWEDTRAAVFQTANLMFEFDRVLNR